MDPNFNYYDDSMNGANFNQGLDLADSGLEAPVYEAPTPDEIFMHPAPSYNPPSSCCMQDQAQNNYNAFMPNTMTPGGFQEDHAYPQMMTPESSDHHVNKYDNIAYHDANSAHEPMPHRSQDQEPEPEPEESKENSLPTFPPQDWRTLLPHGIPSYIEAPLATIPEIHTLHTAYTASLSSPTATNTTRMTHAKALAFTLLTHDYPTSHGYTIHPTSPGPLASRGLSSILATSDASDIWTDPTPPMAPKRSRKKGSGPSKRHVDLAQKDNEWNHAWLYTTNLHFDFIPPEDIAAFAVMKSHHGTGECKIHTFLTILVDTFDQPPVLSRANFTHRSDGLADALCRGGGVKEGYGMLMYGPLMEVYRFDAGAEWVFRSEGEDDEGVEQDVEPKMEVLVLEDGRGFEVDLRRVGGEALDVMFKQVASREVIYACDE
jgi:hypothetical protein